MRSVDTRILSVPSKVLPCKSVAFRSLLPLEPCPVTINSYPSLPSGLRTGQFVPGYTISTHIFPAAYPRCPSSEWSPPSAENYVPESKEHVQSIVHSLAQKKETQEEGKDARNPNRNVLWTVGNRIVNTSPRTSEGLTLIFLHGIGAHKETWEPTIRRLLDSFKSSSVHIEEVWVLDCVQHGDAGLLNENLLGDTFDCADYSRDLMNFVLAYLPENVSTYGLGLPLNLSRLPESQIRQRAVDGIQSRTLVGIGHSVGACSFVYPAVQHPRMFSSLIMIESFTIPEYVKHLDAHRKNEAMCLRRRWVWDSRGSAATDLLQSAYYRSWDRNVLGQYIQHAIIQTQGGKYRLKTHPYLEALMLFERSVVYETWDMLTKIDPDVPIHWIWGGKSKRGGGPEVQTQTSYRHPGRNSNTWYPGVDHFVPQEAPQLLAEDIYHFLDDVYGAILQAKL